MNWVMIGSTLGFFGVALGAFGAHGLASKLDAHSMEIYHTATLYQLVHSVALLSLGAWMAARPDLASTPQAAIPGWAFSLGCVIFSGSLYALAITGIKVLGAITPIGGIAFLVGWASLGMLALRS